MLTPARLSLLSSKLPQFGLSLIWPWTNIPLIPLTFPRVAHLWRLVLWPPSSQAFVIPPSSLSLLAWSSPWIKLCSLLPWSWTRLLVISIAAIPSLPTTVTFLDGASFFATAPGIMISSLSRSLDTSRKNGSHCYAIWITTFTALIQTVWFNWLIILIKSTAPLLSSPFLSNASGSEILENVFVYWYCITFFFTKFAHHPNCSRTWTSVGFRALCRFGIWHICEWIFSHLLKK